MITGSRRECIGIAVGDMYNSLPKTLFTCILAAESIQQEMVKAPVMLARTVNEVFVMRVTFVKGRFWSEQNAPKAFMKKSWPH